MADPLTNLAGSPPRPPPLQKSPFSSFRYGAIAMASIAILLLTYNFIVLRWCWRNHRARRRSDPHHGRMISSSSTRMLLPLSKYRKDEADTQASDTECSVCLSVFADGEDVRQLPQCKHSFHANCIDMWLFSHSDCPLCRTKLAV